MSDCFAGGAGREVGGGTDRIGGTKAGTGVSIMVLVEASALAESVDAMSASPLESQR